MSETKDLIEDVLVDESEKENLRRELFEFLEDFRHKKNDEGNPIIQFPKNFDQISDAMTRQDLTSTEDKTWSKYLLEEKFDQDSQTNFEGGRYSDLVRDSQSDVLVNRGLAEIHLLDKQINNLDKKARQLPGSARGGRKGKKHNNVDSTTFITGAASVNGDDSSNLDTARSAATVHSESPDYIDEDGNSTGTPKVSPRPRTSDDGLPTTNGQDYVPEAEQEKQKNAELRLEAILNVGDEDEDGIWKSLSRYGYTEESQMRIQDIERQLSTIHAQSVSFAPHLSEQLSHSLSVLSNQEVRVAMTDASQSQISMTSFPPLPGDAKNIEEAQRSNSVSNSRVGDSKDAPAKKERRENVLQKQRVSRLMKEYEKKIDDLILRVHSEELNISGLTSSSSLNCYPPPPSSFLPSIAVPSGGEVGNLSKKTAMQSAEATIIGRLVTMEDVEHVIEELCYRNDDVSTDHSAPLSRQSCQRESSSSWSREHGLKMDHLLATIRPDVARLAGERQQHNLGSQSASVDEAASQSIQSYRQRLQEYMKMFAAEGEERGRQEEGSRRGINSSLSVDADLMGDTGIDDTCNTINHTPNTKTAITTREEYMLGSSHDGTLSRMTTQELKVANNYKTNIPQRINRNGNTDDTRLQAIIQDIMTKKTSPKQNLCDETELVINLEHAHDKIQAILNRHVERQSYNSEGDME